MQLLSKCKRILRWILGSKRHLWLILFGVHWNHRSNVFNGHLDAQSLLTLDGLLDSLFYLLLELIQQLLDWIKSYFTSLWLHLALDAL